MLAPSRVRIAVCLLVAGIAAACSDSVNSPDGQSIAPRFAKSAPSTNVAVTSAAPSAAPQNVTVDVQINGSGFVTGSTAEWLLAGQPDARVKTNSTRFVSSTSLVANLTISPDAVPANYDIAVATPQGKKGIGTEAFTVLPMEQLVTPSGNSNATGVNSSGVIAGYRSGGCNSGALPSVWLDPDTRIDLPFPSGYCQGKAARINDTGVVLGIVIPQGNSIAMAAIWISGESGYVPSILGTIPGGAGQLTGGLNNVGHAAFHMSGGAPGKIHTAAWWSESTGVVALAFPGGSTNCVAEDLNDLDQIVGECMDNSAFKPVIWDSPSAVPYVLPLPSGYTGGGVRGLNNSGIAVGQVSVTKSGKITYAGARWTRTGTSWQVETLPDLGGGESLPLQVSDDGWIVGRSTVSASQYRAALWLPGGGVTNLGGFGPGSIAYEIMPSGSIPRLIVGQSAVGGDNRATIWRP